MKKSKLNMGFITVFFIINSLSFAENVVELDLNSDTMKSTDGLEANYGDITLNVLEARRDREANKVYIEKPFTARLRNPAGRGYLKGTKGEMTLDGNTGDFYNAQGYLEVGNATGAEYPNDKLYYGGDLIQYRDGNAIIHDGWFTTDPKIRKVEDPTKVGYHLRSKTTTIEPDKQLTLEGIDFYKGEKSYLPAPFPWYRANIRQGSTVPLFPSYSSGDEDYGFSSTWGTLWGNKDDKYRGGFAPKVSDKLGLMVGRMEHWYETEDYGTSKWNMTDAIIDKKDEDTDRRFQNEFSHDYTGEYGKFSGNIISATNNMIPSLDDKIEDFNDMHAWKKLGMKDKEVKDTDRTEFITLDTDLTGMGARKDISFTGKVKQVTDKDAYDIMLFDEFDDGTPSAGFNTGTGTNSGKEVNNYGYSNSALYTELGLYKDNEDYKIGGYYRYLDELAPGSTRSDRSKDESFGFEVQDKRNKLHLTYDKSTRDKYRPLTFMEQDEDLDATLFTNRGESLGDGLTSRYGDYTVTSIPEYEKYNSEKFKFVAGEYSIGNFKSTSGYEIDKKENELSLLTDPTRDTIKGNTRDREYNRYQNIIYEDRETERGWTSLSNRDYGLTIGGGKEKVEIHDRDGFYNYTYGDIKEGRAYKKYEYETEFVDYKLEKKPFAVGNLGDFGFYGGGRYDQYSDQYVTGVSDSDLIDNSSRLDLGFSHDKEIFSNESGNVDNSFKYSYQDYDKENELLMHSENFNKFEDTIKFDFGQKEGTYKTSYDLVDSAGTGERKNEIFDNTLDFKISQEQNIKFSYSSNKRFTNENEADDNKNDLTYENYGVNYILGKHDFSYQRDSIEYEIWQIEDTDDSYETIDIDTYGYGYTFDNKDKLSFKYITGKDKRDNYDLGETEIDTKKRSYNVSYFDYGDRYDNTYTVGYGRNRYLASETGSDTLSSDTYRFGYTFVDKSMDPEFLKTYAMQEYDKEDVTSEELDKVASLLKERKQQNKDGISGFQFSQFKDRPLAFSGDYNRKFSFNGYAERNKERYDETGDFLDSLEDAGFNMGYSQRRIGIGIGYSKEMNDEVNWTNEDEEYSLMINLKVGKPSESYRITAYGKLEREWYDDESELANTIGIELGKEMGYYEWSIAYFTEYDYGDRQNDWQVAIQFALLTFPDMPIFGIGSSKKPGEKAGPESSFLSGIKANDVDFDDD